MISAKKINILKDKIVEIEELVDSLLLSSELKKKQLSDKEKIISKLKEEIQINQEFNGSGKGLFIVLSHIKKDKKDEFENLLIAAFSV